MVGGLKGGGVAFGFLVILVPNPLLARFRAMAFAFLAAPGPEIVTREGGRLVGRIGCLGLAERRPLSLAAACLRSTENRLPLVPPICLTVLGVTPA